MPVSYKGTTPAHAVDVLRKHIDRRREFTRKRVGSGDETRIPHSPREQENTVVQLAVLQVGLGD